MHEFCVRGVVRGGQVVIDVPLDLPDGTVVFVADHAPDDVATIGRDDPGSREAMRQLLLGLMKRREPQSGADGRPPVGG